MAQDQFPKLIVDVLIPLLVAVLGGLTTIVFSRPKKDKGKTIVFSVSSVGAAIGKIGLPFKEGVRVHNSIVIKRFDIKNVGEAAVEDLIVEYKNLKLNPDKFDIKNDPSQGLLESYYDVAFSEERESLRYTFKHFPAGATFSSTVTFNDYWTYGLFQANSPTARILDAEEHSKNEMKLLIQRNKKTMYMFVASMGVSLAIIVMLILRGANA